MSRSNDTSAFEALYDRHTPTLFKVLARGVRSKRSDGVRVAFIKSGSAQEEIVQATWVEFWRSTQRGTFDDTRPALPYLCTILYRQAVQHLAQQLPIAKERGDVREAIEPLSIEDIAVDRDFVAKIEAGLETRDRDVFELRFVNGLSEREVGEGLGITRDVVAKSVGRIRRIARDLRETSARETEVSE